MIQVNEWLLIYVLLYFSTVKLICLTCPPHVRLMHENVHGAVWVHFVVSVPWVVGEIELVTVQLARDWLLHANSARGSVT